MDELVRVAKQLVLSKEGADREEGGSEHWVPNESCKRCFECDQSFTLFIRKHHCRICGHVFCAQCTQHSLPTGNESTSHPAKVCNYCYEKCLMTAASEGPKDSNQVCEPMETSIVASEMDRSCGERCVSPQPIPPREQGRSSPTGQTSTSDAKLMLEVFGSSPYALLRKSKFGYVYDASVHETPSSNHSLIPEPTVPHEDASTLMAREGQKHTDTKVENTAKLEFLQDSGMASIPVTAGTKSTVASDQSWPSSEGYIPTSGNTRDLLVYKREVEDVEWNPPRGIDEEDQLQDQGYLVASSSGRELHNRLRTDVQSYMRDYYMTLARQIIESVCMDDFEKWVQILPVLAESAAAAVDKLQALKCGVMEPKFFIKIKRVQGSTPERSSIVQGITCRKNVVHKKMPKKIISPKIMILRGSVEYQRIENQLSSFDTLMDQEKQHLQLSVSRIMQHKPDVILLEHTMSRYAQELLLENQVALVLNVKSVLLERIARCTGAKITPAKELFKFSGETFGSCAEFRVEHMPTGCSGAKTLMHFEGCPVPLGCTVLLHGPSQHLLEGPKKALQFLCLAAWNSSLEESFMTDLLVAASSSSLLQQQKMVGGSAALQQIVQVTTSLPKYLAALNASNFQGLPCSISPNVLLVDHPDLEKSFLLGESASGVNQNSSWVCRDQQIFMSISATCPPKGQLCEPAQMHRIDFYSQTDVPLSFFLSAVLPDAQSICPHQACKEKATSHVRYYRHGDAQVTLSCHELDEDQCLPAAHSESEYWVWTNKPCAKRCPLHPLSGCLSLGEFFTLVFSLGRATHSLRGYLTSNHDSDKDFTDDVKACLDALPFEQDTSALFIGHGRSVVRFCYQTINAYRVSLPAKELQLDSASDIEWRVSEVAKLAETADESFQEILASIDALLSVHLGNDNHKTTLQAWRQEAELEMRLFGEQLEGSSVAIEGFAMEHRSDSPLEGSPPLHILEVNKLKRSLVEALQHWSSRVCEAHTWAAEKKPFVTNKGQPQHINRGSVVQSEHSMAEKEHASFGHKRSQSVPVLPIDAGSESSTSAVLSDTPERQLPPSQAPSCKMSKSADNSAIEASDTPQLPVLPRLRGRLFLPDGQNKEVVVVYDNEPTTIIAHMLVSEVYRAKLLKAAYFAKSEGGRLANAQESLKQLRPAEPATTEKKKSSLTRVRERSIGGEMDKTVGARSSPIRTEELLESSPPSNHPPAGSNDGLYTMSGSPSLNEMDVLLSKEPAHIDHTFEDTSISGHRSQFKVVAVYAPQFAELRKVALSGDGEEGYIKSLCRCMKWDSRGGKSNAYFAKTLDNRLVVKQISRSEMHSFLQFGPSYFEYMSTVLSSDLPSSLCKILGVYQLSIKHVGASSERDMRIDLMVMENVFYGRKVSKIYDLKGSLRSRYADENCKPETVLLDENLVQQLVSDPLLVYPTGHAHLLAALRRDTEMLARLNVMDYSLIVGVDEERKELVFAVIDYIRQYTWDKQLESWVKSYGILGGGKRVPTIITPKDYMKRFLNAMALYFTAIPSSDPVQIF